MSRIHLIAIGGSAMHNLALELKAKGHEVTGSDDKFFDPSKSRLERASLLPEKEGWDAARITSDIDLIILGMHAHRDNPELERALDLGLTIQSYPEFVFEQSKDRTRVVVAGSHGKTSITSMILHVMHQVSEDVNYLVGALLEGFERMVRLDPNANFIVIEGDEYGSSALDPRPKFHWYHPNIAIISGIAWDHANIFPSEENYQEQFAEFVKNIEPGGTLIYCQEDEQLDKLVKENSNEIKLFPYNTPEYSAGSEGSILHSDEGEVPLKIFGKHNIQNLEAARLVCNQLGVMDDEFYAAISNFEGASRRLEQIADDERGVFYRDFAHAPSKVRATVNAVREQYVDKKVIALLELHTYSSLNPEFLPQYKGAMDLADEAIIYFNPEVVQQKRLPDLSPADVQRHFGNDSIEVLTNMDEAKSRIEGFYGTDSVFLLMSSGNFAGQTFP